MVESRVPDNEAFMRLRGDADSPGRALVVGHEPTRRAGAIERLTAMGLVVRAVEDAADLRVRLAIDREPYAALLVQASKERVAIDLASIPDVRERSPDCVCVVTSVDDLSDAAAAAGAEFLREPYEAIELHGLLVGDAMHRSFRTISAFVTGMLDESLAGKSDAQMKEELERALGEIFDKDQLARLIPLLIAQHREPAKRRAADG